MYLPHSRLIFRAGFLALVAVILLLTLISCTGNRNSSPTAGPTSLSNGSPTPLSEPGVAATTAATVAVNFPTPQGPTVITLSWWIPPQLAPTDENEAGRILTAQLETFQEANPTVRVRPVLKAPHGKGGLLDFLLNAQKVAPTVLPDLVALNSEDLAVAMRAGLLQPLNSLLSDDLLSDLYPFATEVGKWDDNLYAVQFEADIEHLAVNSDRVQAPPRSWAELLATDYTYIFATGSENNPGDAFLIQYKAAGGQLGQRSSSFVLNAEALLSVLEFYSQGRASGIIPPTVLSLASTEDLWSVFSDGQADLAHVLASRYLSERTRLPNLGFGPVPTMDGRPATISRGWTLAIVTADPARQAAAARLIEALLAVEVNGAWTQAAHRLPTRRSALDLWNQEDPYVSFLRWQLEAAVYHASGESFLKAAPVLARAQRDVLSGTLTPREAVERATGLSLPSP